MSKSNESPNEQALDKSEIIIRNKETNQVKAGLKDKFDKGADLVAVGMSKAKQGVVDTVKSIHKTGKDTQMAVLSYVTKKKNARFLKTKLASFEDGLKEGKNLTVEYIQKYANFCLAATAISFYFARCDGEISDEEMLEIQFDLDSIIKNRDLPDALRNKLAEISLKTDLSFEEVKVYLDGVSVETLKEFAKDIDEIILANGEVTQLEEKSKKDFDCYLMSRMEA